MAADTGAAVPIVPADNAGIATDPSITTSTAVVNALTTRSDGSPVVQQGAVESLPQAAANDTNRSTPTLVGSRMSKRGCEGSSAVSVAI